MSRAWYKPNAAPRLLGSILPTKGKHKSGLHRQVQVWNTTCIVTKSGKQTVNGSDGSSSSGGDSMNCSVLINPANPQLSGVSKFPYFPKGGPVPKEYPKRDAGWHATGYVTQWGGMEVGEGMLFASNVVDGLVHQLGGWQLGLECKFLPILQNNEQEGGERCPVGQAVTTGAGASNLKVHFDSIVHTVPPFYHHHPSNNPEQLLLEAYRNALAAAFAQGKGDLRVACPLLGAGGRGFPLEVAIRVAGQASQGWLDQDLEDESNDSAQHHTLAFGIPDIDIAEQLLETICRTTEQIGRKNFQQ